MWESFTKILANIQKQIHPLSSVSDNETENFVMDYQLPNEIFLCIFEHVPDKCLIQVIPLVCKNWHSLSRSWHLWKRRLYNSGIKISPARLERIHSSWDEAVVLAAVQCLCLFRDKKAFNHNLLKNPSGAEGFAHWRITDGGDRLIVEDHPVGCDPIPAEAKLPTQHCFVSSYTPCKRAQGISLCRDFGIRNFVLEVLRPTLVISEWVSSRFDCGGVSEFYATVIGEKTQPLVVASQWKDSDFGRVEWHRVEKKINYEDLPTNVTTILFKNKSSDTQFWAGHYGAKTAGSSVVLDISQDYDPQALVKPPRKAARYSSSSSNEDDYDYDSSRVGMIKIK